MDNNLIIFIDSLPFYYLDETSHMTGYPLKCKVVPGLGYSINIHAELFGGYSPDEVGFFNEWTYDPENAPLRKLKFAEPILKKINRESLAYRAIKKIICTAFNVKPFDVRPDYLCRFSRKGQEVYRIERSKAGNRGSYSFSFPRPTIFNTLNKLTTVMPDISAKRGGSRDYSVYLQARDLVKESGNLFLWFPDLDGIAHAYGVGSDKYHEHILYLDKWIEELKQMFLSYSADRNILIFSDHGMATVNSEIDLKLEENVGKAGEESYYYFLDSTILRVWIKNRKYIDEVEKYLKGLDSGYILDNKTREKYGLSLKKFGDLIYVLSEGIIFNPATIFSSKAGSTKAMHGYLPELESQKGMFISSKNIFDSKEITTIDLYNHLIQALRNN